MLSGKRKEEGGKRKARCLLVVSLTSRESRGMPTGQHNDRPLHAACLPDGAHARDRKSVSSVFIRGQNTTVGQAPFHPLNPLIKKITHRTATR